MTAADADAEQLRQGVDHLHRLGIAPLLTHPGDGVEGIIEEVGIDLGLEGLEFGLSEVDLLPADRVHQLLDFHHHVAEGFRELLHLQRAAHRGIGEAVGPLFKLPHGRREALEGPGQGAGNHNAADEGRQQNRHGRQYQQPGDFPDVGRDQLVHIADAHHPPGASLHCLDGVDDVVLAVNAVGAGGQCAGVLGLEPGVDQLLLGVIENPAALVHQEAVAVLADAHVVDVRGDAAKAQVHRHPSFLAAGLQRRQHSDNPGIPSLEDRFHMGLGDIPPGVVRERFPVEREIFMDLLPGRVVQRPAVEQLPVRAVGGDGCHIGSDFQEVVKKLLSDRRALGRCLERRLHQGHHAAHIVDIARHGVADLIHSLAGGGLGAALDGPAIGPQEQRHGTEDHPQYHAGHHHHQHGGHAPGLSALHVPPPLRLRATGETP